MKEHKHFKRLISLILVVAMIAMMVGSAMAYSSTSRTIQSGVQYVSIETGRGLMYWLGWKRTTVTVKNTGKNPVYVYKNIGRWGYAYEGQLRPGQTKQFSAPGSGSRYSIMLQGSGRKTTVNVSSNAGCVW